MKEAHADLVSKGFMAKLDDLPKEELFHQRDQRPLQENQYSNEVVLDAYHVLLEDSSLNLCQIWSMTSSLQTD